MSILNVKDKRDNIFSINGQMGTKAKGNMQCSPKTNSVNLMGEGYGTILRTMKFQ